MPQLPTLWLGPASPLPLPHEVVKIIDHVGVEERVSCGGRAARGRRWQGPLRLEREALEKLVHACEEVRLCKMNSWWWLTSKP
jgi:hypothetical protein